MDLTTQILWSRLVATVEEQARTLMRTAFSPTVREADGLAMSSRNVYLSAEERAAAPILHRCMSRAAQRIRDGEALEAALSPARNKIADLAPLVAAAKADAEGKKTFAPFLRLYTAGNPLSDAAKNEQIAALRSRGVVA